MRRHLTNEPSDGDAGAGGRDGPPAEAAKRELIDAYRVARAELDEALAALPPRTPVAGWTALEIAAHVAAWERHATEVVPSLARGAAAAAPDVDAFNASAASAARGHDPEATLREYRDATSSFVAALEAAPADAFERGRLRDRVAVERQHCLEHAAELRAVASRRLASVQRAPRAQDTGRATATRRPGRRI